MILLIINYINIIFDKIKDELYEGNAYQINYTLKKIYECFDSGLNTYLALRNIVKPPYGYYIKYNNCEILSFFS